MDQERDQIREVDDARRRVAEDVRNVAENANVVERAKESAQNKMDDVKSNMGQRVQQARDRLMDARDQMQHMSPSDNPIGMLIAGAAVGFLIGLALPVSRFESERIGPIAHDMKDKARQAGNEVVRRSGEVIKETISAGKDAATTSIREQTRDIGMSGGE
ncbi:MAG TPA: hypothetical protein VJP85_06635 [Candidatus Baltobacteraceae bacterium]|nr:hypothetical protein [Candidatus Baltobacteraceae bacterium]